MKHLLLTCKYETSSCRMFDILHNHSPICIMLPCLQCKFCPTLWNDRSACCQQNPSLLRRSVTADHTKHKCSKCWRTRGIIPAQYRQNTCTVCRPGQTQQLQPRGCPFPWAIPVTLQCLGGTATSTVAQDTLFCLQCWVQSYHSQHRKPACF